MYTALHSCDYLKKILIKINVATGEGNGQRQIPLMPTFYSYFKESFSVYILYVYVYCMYMYIIHIVGICIFYIYDMYMYIKGEGC